jgi:hypothetical protein
VIDWKTILYGAALSALVAALVLAVVARDRRATIVFLGALAAAGGPIAWNAILRATHGDRFFTDAPISWFPISWQDTGSGVFALAAAALLYGLVNAGSARRATSFALLAALAALLVDVYLY